MVVSSAIYSRISGKEIIMKKIKTIAIITALAMLMTCLPMMAFGATTTVPQVKGLTATQSSYSQAVVVKWTKAKNVKGYKVYQKIGSDGTYKCIKTITKGSTVKYTTGKRTAGKTYYYKVKAYKVVKNKKKYGKYSSVKSVKIVNEDPVVSYKNGNITNTTDGTNAITTITVTPSSKNAKITFYNNSDAMNSVTRYTGVGEDVLKNIKSKVEEFMELLLGDADLSDEYIDNTLLGFEGNYGVFTVAPYEVYIKEGSGEYAKVGSTFTMSPGKTYTVKFVTPITSKVRFCDLEITKDTDGSPVALMRSAKTSITNVYNGFNAEEQGVYTFAFGYRGDDYTATFARDFDKDGFPFGLSIE